MKTVSRNWNPSLRQKAEDLLESLEGIEEKDFIEALDKVAFERLSDFQRGVKAYHEHPYVRDLEDPDVVFTDGNSRLLDYGGPDGAPVMVCVPSLINPAYVLDLSASRSFVRSMAEKGIRTYLLDWGELGPLERTFNFDDYIVDRLQSVFDFVQQKHAQRIHLLGYCMGGTMATAFASLNPDTLASLILLATPWDFHAGNGAHKTIIEAQKLPLEMGIKMAGVLSTDIIQGLFSAIDPYGVINKFQKFAHMKSNSAKAKHFVAMEDWVNDGEPIAGDVAKTCLFDWYVKNTPAQNQWEVAGETIDPSKITCPTLIYVANKDRIVLPESAHALGTIIPKSYVKTVDSGHVSMVCGQKAIGALYTPLSKWVLNQGM